MESDALCSAGRFGDLRRKQEETRVLLLFVILSTNNR